MTQFRRARLLCIASILCSAIFIAIEIGMGAYAHAAAQACLLMTGIALLALLKRAATRMRASLPPPAVEPVRTPLER